MSESTFHGSREDAYLEWRARLAAKQEARRTQPEAPPKAAPNPMWDPARLFESPASAASHAPAPRAVEREAEPAVPAERIDLRTEAIDLRTPPAPAASSDQAADESAPASPGQPRRLALAANYLQSQPPPSSASAPSSVSPLSIADGLRELNEQRVNGMVTDEEFKARKAELFARSSGPAGTAPPPLSRS